ncbi:MAG: DUF420 domain-containing protein [Mariprofundaceae bacterium]|nr:DUF420 domain-containing protein [Mariprofundaceae bacterium]
MKTFLAQPGFLSPYGTMSVDITYLIAMLATSMFFFGWRKARTGDGAGHRMMMFSASVLMLVYFFVYYLLRNLGGIVAEGKLGFGGPSWVAEDILFPLLTVHLALVLLVFILIPYQLWLGRRTAKYSGNSLKLSTVPLKMKSRVWLRVLLPLVALFFAVGAFRCSNGYCWLFYAGVPLFVAIVIGLERLLERLVPDGGRRHRIVGTVTVSTILLLFASTTGMYAMLHVLYPHVPA